MNAAEAALAAFKAQHAPKPEPAQEPELTHEPSTPSDEAREVERLRARVEELEGLVVEGERVMRVFDRKVQAATRALRSEYQRGLTDGMRRGSPRPARATSSTIYDEKVGKLLNLAMGASTDAESVAAFAMARKLHAKAGA
jgi:hypothetical protein